MSSVALKSVLKSETLYFDRPLDVKDRSTSTSAPKKKKQSDWPVIGSLKVGYFLTDVGANLKKNLFSLRYKCLQLQYSK